MALFWLLAGALSTLAALILLLPWLRTIAHVGPLPSVSWPIAMIAALGLALVVGLYQWLGRPDLAVPAGARFSTDTGNVSRKAAKGSAGSMDSAIASLRARLSKGGGTPDDWELLAKSYEFLGRPDDAARARSKQLPAPSAGSVEMASVLASTVRVSVAAEPTAPTLTAQSSKLLADANAARRNRQPAVAVAIYAKLVAVNQMDADSWADYADSMSSLHGGKLAGEPETFIARALALDPRHPKALWLKASAAEEAGRWSEAVSVWQILQSVLVPGSADAKIVAANLQSDLKRVALRPSINRSPSRLTG